MAANKFSVCVRCLEGREMQLKFFIIFSPEVMFVSFCLNFKYFEIFYSIQKNVMVQKFHICKLD